MVCDSRAEVNGGESDVREKGRLVGRRNELEESANERRLCRLAEIAGLVNEFIVDDRSRQRGTVFAWSGFFEAHHAALAHDIAVLLAGDFLRHLENHLNQGVHGKLLRTVEQDSTLADVFDDSFIPGAGLVHAIA
jgi:hypothetical protein